MLNEGQKGAVLLYLVLTRVLAITLRIIAIAITIMAKKVIDYCNNQ